MSLIEAGWDTDVARRPHGQRTTVVVHLDVESRVAALHLGPLLPDGDRQYLTCDATCEVWFERHGRPIGSGRETRVISRRLRRALQHRDHCCVIPGCAATRGLHAHHLVHWEDGGPTELANLVLVCPYHHRLHHRGLITLRGPAHHLTVTDRDGEPLTSASLGRPPTTPPPRVKPCPDRPANAPTGGGTTPTNPHHHPRRTSRRNPVPCSAVGIHSRGRRTSGEGGVVPVAKNAAVNAKHAPARVAWPAHPGDAVGSAVEGVNT